jgi:hypothetical protein
MYTHLSLLIQNALQEPHDNTAQPPRLRLRADAATRAGDAAPPAEREAFPLSRRAGSHLAVRPIPT